MKTKIINHIIFPNNCSIWTITITLQWSTDLHQHVSIHLETFHLQICCGDADTAAISYRSPWGNETDRKGNVAAQVNWRRRCLFSRCSECNFVFFSQFHSSEFFNYVMGFSCTFDAMNYQLVFYFMTTQKLPAQIRSTTHLSKPSKREPHKTLDLYSAIKY